MSIRRQKALTRPLPTAQKELMNVTNGVKLGLTFVFRIFFVRIDD